MTAKFFYISLSHETLTNHYMTNFQLVQHHKYSLSELDNMIPFERDLYVTLLLQWVEEQNDKQG